MKRTLISATLGTVVMSMAMPLAAFASTSCSSSWYSCFPSYPDTLFTAQSKDAFSLDFDKNSAFASTFNKSFASDLNKMDISKNLFSADNAFRLKERLEDDHLFKLAKINTVKFEETNGINLVKQDHYAKTTDTASQSSVKKANENASALNTSKAAKINSAVKSANSLSKNIDKKSADSVLSQTTY